MQQVKYYKHATGFVREPRDRVHGMRVRAEVDRSVLRRSKSDAIRVHQLRRRRLWRVVPYKLDAVRQIISTRVCNVCRGSLAYFGVEW